MKGMEPVAKRELIESLVSVLEKSGVLQLQEVLCCLLSNDPWGKLCIVAREFLDICCLMYTLRIPNILCKECSVYVSG